MEYLGLAIATMVFIVALMIGIPVLLDWRMSRKEKAKKDNGAAIVPYQPPKQIGGCTSIMLYKPPKTEGDRVRDWFRIRKALVRKEQEKQAEPAEIPPVQVPIQQERPEPEGLMVAQPIRQEGGKRATWLWLVATISLTIILLVSIFFKLPLKTTQPTTTEGWFGFNWSEIIILGVPSIIILTLFTFLLITFYVAKMKGVIPEVLLRTLRNVTTLALLIIVSILLIWNFYIYQTLLGDEIKGFVTDQWQSVNDWGGQNPEVLYYGKWFGGALAILIGALLLSRLFRRRGAPATATAPATPTRATGVSCWDRIRVSFTAVLLAFALFNAIFWWISPETWTTAASERGNFSIAFWASQALGVVVTTFLLATTKISDGYKKTRDVALFGVGFLIIALVLAYIPPGRAWERVRGLWSELMWSASSTSEAKRATAVSPPPARQWVSVSLKDGSTSQIRNLEVNESRMTFSIWSELGRGEIGKVELWRDGDRYYGNYTRHFPTSSGEIWLKQTDPDKFEGAWRGQGSADWVRMEIRPR